MKDDILISRNRAIQDLKEMQTVLAAEGDPFLAGAMNRPIGCIENQPEVDAAPVVHGRWIRRHNETKCSKCQFIYYSNRDDFNYCPNCGAKMDGRR